MASQILIVEDENIVAKDIQHTLQGLAYEVPAIVATAEAAVEKTEQLRPDLVLMDIKLRGSMDGITAAHAIRERWNIPVVYLTAHADSSTLQRAKVTEPFGYVVKPFEERDLHTTIEMALYKHKMDCKLRESEQWLTVTLNSIGDGVIATDDQCRVVFINPVAQALTGWSAEDAVGQPLADVFHIINEHTRLRVENPVAKVLATGMTVGLANHTVLIARDGTERPIDDSGAPIQIPGGPIQGVVMVFRDISERRRLEQAIQQRVAELAEADRRKDEFLAMLGHELRNPLAGITYGVEFLQQLESPQEHTAEVHTIIARQVGHMQHILDDLLEVTRITRGKIVLKKKRFDLVELVRQAVEDQRWTIETKGASLTLHLPPTPLYCDVDPTRLSQTVTNLLVNANKFLGGPGEITVTVRSEPANGWATISVRDTGIGMDEETLGSIFEPFTQADQSLARSQGGLGLGLALVKGLVELHGGRISAASAGPGKGSEFTIELPQGDGESPERST